MADWLALVIGNTRWHWAWFKGSHLQNVWHTPHLSNPQQSEGNLYSMWGDQTPPQLRDYLIEAIDIWAISVVPHQTQYLENLSTVRWLTHFPLKRVYPTMGLDRVVTLWGAGKHYGWPVLVIDAGTALTFTGGAEGRCMGGAILLGVRSHFAALHHQTAALPMVHPPSHCPPYWANDTSSAIQSGVINTLLASIHHFIHSWQQQYPDTAVLFTGGDGEYLYQLHKQTHQTQQNQILLTSTWFDPNLMFWGILAYRNDATRSL